MRVNENFDPDYVQTILASREIHGLLRRSAKGLAGSMPKIDQGTLGQVEIPVISRRRQQDLLAEARAHENGLRHLRTACTQAKERAEALELATLRDALSGELGTTNSDDEPASALLERLRADRAGAASTNAARRRSPRSSTR